jgi:glycerate 2-kinase
MTILIAPDKFKGSLTSQEVCTIIGQVLKQEIPESRIVSLPLADGGEGSCALLTSFSGGTMVSLEVHDPLFRKMQAKYGLSPDRSTAFMEMAAASGLQLLKPEERNPLKTSSYGTGEMIRHALDHDVRKIILGIGGSATNDGGIGLAEALGFCFYSGSGERLTTTGENLNYIRQIDSTQRHPKLGEVDITVFCDVDNPLHGPQGAAHVFASQKGASPSAIMQLDEGLKNLERILEQTFGKAVDFPGAGAGGGLAAMLQSITVLNVTPGMKFIAKFTGLEQRIREADVVITGEGRLDEQTLSGKVVMGVTDIAKRYHKRVIVVTGKSLLKENQIEQLGISQVVTLTGDDVSESEAFQFAKDMLARRVSEKVAFLLQN